MNARRVGILAYDGCQSLDVVGPLEVFHGANAALLRRGSNDPGYAAVVVTPDGAAVRAESGVELRGEGGFAGEAFDSLIVAGGNGVRILATDALFLDQFGPVAARARRLASVCTGAFVLAALGYLVERRATTHWAFCDTLEAMVPGVTVDREALYVRDGSVWTSAGVAAGMDLALALVEDDLGPEIANQVAQWLVLFVRRGASQPQLSEQLRRDVGERPGVRDLLTWIVDHPDCDLSVPVLARKCGMSVRNFARVFRAESGVSPARYVENVRVEAARRLLERTDHSADEVALRCGFGSADTLRRVLGRTVGVGPRGYREALRG